MKYFKHYSEWAVSHSVFSRLGKLFKNEMSQQSEKSQKGGGAASTINNFIIQYVDYYEMRARPYRN